MNLLHVCVFGMAVLVAPQVHAADQLQFGAPPAWVTAAQVPSLAKANDAPIAGLLLDQQLHLEPGTVSNYSQIAFAIQKPEGLAAGSLSISWDPSKETVTVHRLEIRRGADVIDVLKSGQRFTTMRREQNLEFAVLNGVLTANIQPEDLREGDVLVLAMTNVRSDPVLKGHVEATFAGWGSANVQRAQALVSWPASTKLKFKQSGSLPAAKMGRDGPLNTLEMRADGLQPEALPKDAPARYRVGRLGEVTDFNSWADAAALMGPLYDAAAKIPATGALRDEVEKIRAQSKDQKKLAELSLQLVQQRLRYVALLLGIGGYTPATAEESWSRRFGDCKAKTVLLLAMLREFGIEAEPVLVNSSVGDAIADRLPMISVFDHVLVRARIGGKDYWLDGTRTGDSSLDSILVPDFGWGLPLVAGAELVRIVPGPLDKPLLERTVDVDASGGVYSPAKFRITEIRRGDDATITGLAFTQLAGSQRDDAMRELAQKYLEGVEVGASKLEPNPGRQEVRIVVEGTAKLEWNDGWMYVPTSTIAFDPEYDRPAGQLQDVPLQIGHPSFTKDLVSIRLPAGFAAQQKLDPAVSETLAGIEYRRREYVDGDRIIVESSERTIAAEVPYKDALAAEARLKSLSDNDVYLRMPANYRLSETDKSTRMAEKPDSAQGFVLRGLELMNSGDFDAAIDDFSEGLKLYPKDEWLLANRALAHVWKKDSASAQADLDAAAAVNAANPVLPRARGLLAENNSDFRAAVAAYTAALEKDPGSSWTRARRALSRRQIGDEEGAISDSTEALKRDPSLMDLRVMRANIFVNQANNEAVAREAELLVKENPKSDFAYVAAGRIYGRIGRKADAMKAFDTALEIAPASYIYVNRAQVRPFTDYAGRLRDLDEALKLDPKDVDALAEKAEQLAVTGNLKGALAIYDDVMKLDPGNEQLELHRSIILHKTGVTSEAEKLFADRRSKAKTALQLNALCWSKATAGIMLESALQDCADSLKLDPELGAVLDSMGFVQLRLGKLDEAIDYYSRAIAKKSGSASYMGRSIAYARKGDKARAEADQAEALRLDQDAKTKFAEYGVSQ